MGIPSPSPPLTGQASATESPHARTGAYPESGLTYKRLVSPPEYRLWTLRLPEAHAKSASTTNMGESDHGSDALMQVDAKGNVISTMSLNTGTQRVALALDWPALTPRYDRRGQANIPPWIRLAVSNDPYPVGSDIPRRLETKQCLLMGKTYLGFEVLENNKAIEKTDPSAATSIGSCDIKKNSNDMRLIVRENSNIVLEMSCSEFGCTLRKANKQWNVAYNFSKSLLPEWQTVAAAMDKYLADHTVQIDNRDNCQGGVDNAQHIC